MKKIDFNVAKDEPFLSKDDKKAFDAFERTNAGASFASGKLEGFWISSDDIGAGSHATFPDTRAQWNLTAESGVLEATGTEKFERRKLKFAFEGELDETGLVRGWKKYSGGKDFPPVRYLGRREETMINGRFVVVNPHDDSDRRHGAFFLLPSAESEDFVNAVARMLEELYLVNMGSPSISRSMKAAHNELVARLGEGDPPLGFAERWPKAGEGTYDEQHWEYLVSVDAFFRGTGQPSEIYGHRTRWALRAVIYDYLFQPNDDRDDRIEELEARVADLEAAR